eukprot:1370886-Amorphochlora_amoeboformis.AAC.2
MGSFLLVFSIFVGAEALRDIKHGRGPLGINLTFESEVWSEGGPQGFDVAVANGDILEGGEKEGTRKERENYEPLHLLDVNEDNIAAFEAFGMEEDVGKIAQDSLESLKENLETTSGRITAVGSVGIILFFAVCIIIGFTRPASVLDLNLVEKKKKASLVPKVPFFGIVKHTSKDAVQDIDSRRSTRRENDQLSVLSLLSDKHQGTIVVDAKALSSQIEDLSKANIPFKTGNFQC